MTRPVAAAGAVVFRDETVLLIRRSRAPLKGSWSLPGGKIELLLVTDVLTSLSFVSLSVWAPCVDASGCGGHGSCSGGNCTCSGGHSGMGA